MLKRNSRSFANAQMGIALSNDPNKSRNALAVKVLQVAAQEKLIPEGKRQSIADAHLGTSKTTLPFNKVIKGFSCQKKIMAERQGFEPWVGLHPQRFSRPPRSTTPAPLLGAFSRRFSLCLQEERGRVLNAGRFGGWAVSLWRFLPGIYGCFPLTHGRIPLIHTQPA